MMWRLHPHDNETASEEKKPDGAGEFAEGLPKVFPLGAES